MTAIQQNPNQYIENALKDCVRTSPKNRLASFGNEPIFDEPLIGFADGSDPIFMEFKKVVHEKHYTPLEILTKAVSDAGPAHEKDLSAVSVVSFVLPIPKETRRSNAREKKGPSLRWNHTRWHGQDFINALSADMVALLTEAGYAAVAPEISPYFRIYAVDNGFASNWSQRHMAYAAGLGTFSLNDGFITQKGLTMRCGSFVTNLRLEPSKRSYSNHLANCLFYAGGKCDACIRRCPYGAITEKGHDKQKCREVLFEIQKPWLEGAHGEGYTGPYAGCGLCQTGVPCESRIPVRKK